MIPHTYSISKFQMINTYTAKMQAGPSKTEVNPSILTMPDSLAAYRESPLLYSFPGKLCTWILGEHPYSPFITTSCGYRDSESN